MASKRKVAKPRPVAQGSKAVGEWLITCEGNAQNYSWAKDLPAAAEFQITQTESEGLFFVPGQGCQGDFSGDRKPLTEVKTRIGSRAFHDGEEVTKDRFRLRMTLNGKTFGLWGFRRPPTQSGQCSDEGLIEILAESQSVDRSIASTRRPVVFLVSHGGPHGEPKPKATNSAWKGAAHKLVGRWKIVDQGKVKDYPWASGLPKGAVFEITADLEFVPVRKCTDLFKERRKGQRWLGRLPLRHEGEHENVPLLDDETLRLTLADGSLITFNGSHKPKPGKDKGRVSISGPGAGLAGLVLTHGGPHGEPE